MDAEPRIYIHEDHPLNTPGATIYLTAGKTRKVNSSNDLNNINLKSQKTDKQADLGVHLNTTFSIASSKKIRLLILLNFLLSLVCMVICFSVACYYWNEMSSLRRQIDMMKDQLMIQNLGQEKVEQRPITSPLVRPRRPQDERPSRQTQNEYEVAQQELENSLPIANSKKDDTNKQINYFATIQKDLLIAQFNGAIKEHNIGSKTIVGPWTRDEEVSSKNSNDKIELNKDHVIIKEGGLYLVYAQVVYLARAPNCYYIWARQTAQKPRLLSTCATGNDSSGRPLDHSQMSCAVQIVARLYAGDSVNISQREPNRTLLLQPGYSYFGFVKLSS